ncbi:MAG: S49 family peptidase [Phycisphaerales bacterium]|nr:S49 family peptidase [Phycisphaerales bacterium]
MPTPITPQAVRRSLLAALAAAAAGLAGCIPSRVTLDLAPGDGKIRETEVLADTATGFDRPKVALIDVAGVISSGATPGLFASRGNPVDSLVARLDKAEKDPSVKAVLLRVNSPGGTVAASETMHREIAGFRARSGKPVVVSMGDVAASGGYYISLAGDRIVAQPSTITGSIGVIVQTFNFARGMDRIGISGRAVTSRPNKDLTNPFEPMREDHYRIMQSMVDDFYAKFRALVVARRGERLTAPPPTPPTSPTSPTPVSGEDAAFAASLPADRDARIDLLTDGRVLTGSQALAAGLIDQTGDLREAFAEAKRLAGVPAARLVKYHADGQAPNSPYALTDLEPRAAATGRPSELNLIQINLPDSLHPTAGFYYLWSPGL